MTTKLCLTDAYEQAPGGIRAVILAFLPLAFGAGVDPTVIGSDGDIVQLTHRPNSVPPPGGARDFELGPATETEEIPE